MLQHNVLGVGPRSASSLPDRGGERSRRHPRVGRSIPTIEEPFMVPSRSRLRGVLSATLVGVGCAYPPPVPLRFPDLPGPNPDRALVGPLEISGRAGAEWIELTLRNGGGGAVTIDWGASALMTPGGRWHGLVPSERLAMAMGSGVPMEVAGNAPWPFPGPPLRAGLARYSEGPHERPPDLRELKGLASVLPAGASYEFVLYPAEHLHLDGFGFWAEPLLCDEGGGAGDGTFALSVVFGADGITRSFTLRASPLGGGMRAP